MKNNISHDSGEVAGILWDLFCQHNDLGYVELFNTPPQKYGYISLSSLDIYHLIKGMCLLINNKEITGNYEKRVSAVLKALEKVKKGLEEDLEEDLEEWG